MVISRQTDASTLASTHALSLPTSYLNLFLEHLVPKSSDRARVFAMAGLELEHLDRRQLPLDRVIALVCALDEMLPAGWHVEPCLRLEPAQHGPVGLAAISAATVGEALLTIQRFERLQAPWSSARLYREGPRQVLEIQQRHRLSEGADLLMEMNLLALTGLVASLLGRFRSALQLELPGAERSWHADLRHRLGADVLTGRQRTALSMPAKRLSGRCLLADPELHELMTHRCRRLHRQPDDGRTTARVMTCLADYGGRNPGLATVARELGLSERSLSRSLAGENTSYRRLLDQSRYQMAQELLCHSTLPIADIANRVGYTDPANFNRAFRRWSGQSPGEVRRNRRSSQERGD